MVKGYFWWVSLLMFRRFILSLVLILFAWGLPSHLVAAPQVRGSVRWVDDGDTIVLEGGERVRYLGINTPEIAHGNQPAEPYGDEAYRFNRSLVLGRRVKLELGEQGRDQYGRLLAYVFLEDGTFVNGELVRLGYAHLLRRQPNLPYWDRLLQLQRQALKEKKGIWSIPVDKPENSYLGNKRSWVFHRPHCPFGLKTAAGNQVRFSDRYEALYQGYSPGRRCRP
jgi:endonuclease YncB( thermonuclease family)